MDPPATGAVADASVRQDASNVPPQQAERDQLQVLRCWCTCCIEQHSKQLIAAVQLKVASCIKDLLTRLPDDCARCRCCSCQPCFHTDIRLPCTVMCTQPGPLCAMLCHAVLCCPMLGCAMLCRAMLCCAVLCCAAPPCALPCCAMLCRAMLCCAVLCCAVPCCAVPCCAMLCCAMLCRAVLCRSVLRQAACKLRWSGVMVQGFLLGALSVLLVDGACRAPLLAAEPGLATLIKLCSRLPGSSQPWQGERRTLAARTLCSCIQRDSQVRRSIITSGGNVDGIKS